MIRKTKRNRFDFGDALLPLKEIEKMYTERVLDAVGGNIESAARILGVSSRTLYRWNRTKRSDVLASPSELVNF